MRSGSCEESGNHKNNAAAHLGILSLSLLFSFWYAALALRIDAFMRKKKQRPQTNPKPEILRNVTPHVAYPLVTHHIYTETWEV
jgi:hypothetical protein